VSEQERIDLEWQAERKLAKRAYMKELEDYEEDKEKEAVSAQLCRSVPKYSTRRWMLIKVLSFMVFWL
jgi:hypothetical protein